MAQVAVAVLDVDEVEPRRLRQPGGGHEVLDEGLDLLVAHHRVIALGPIRRVEKRVVVQGARLGSVPAVRVRHAAGVRELHADEQVVRGGEALLVAADEERSQLADLVQVLLDHHELDRAAPAVRPYGHRLGAEDQLGSAGAPALPAPPRQVGGPPVGRVVPALHREDGEPVADPVTAHLEGLRQRRARAGADDVVKGECDARRLEIGAEGGSVLQAANIALARAHDGVPP